MRSASYLVKWLAALDERYRLLALGIDLRRYAVFDAYAPRPFYPLTADGSPNPFFVTGADQVQLDDDAFERCHLFVIETALRLDAEDYDFNGPALRRSQGICGRLAAPPPSRAAAALHYVHSRHVRRSKGARMRPTGRRGDCGTPSSRFRRRNADRADLHAGRPQWHHRA